ncbi:hypothetical protein [Nostoc sp. WHI]|uniref:hypothetical protein n=1 Tax=Nostoc sp. WHI TaxID=2650611 RepID=UPI0018C582DF|nr:hypothetical protein [Nostoc sp. WHI]MBG1267765.1 hypothetical protein [Nostoc sp. WHI]
MKIKLIHAHFLISIGDYSNERIGFTGELEPGETVAEAVEKARKDAVEAVGPKAQEFYQKKHDLRAECNEIERRLAILRREWDATAEFLKTQGIKTDAPPMPLFRGLLSPAIEHESVSEAEIIDDDY